MFGYQYDFKKLKMSLQEDILSLADFYEKDCVVDEKDYVVDEKITDDDII